MSKKSNQRYRKETASNSAKSCNSAKNSSSNSSANSSSNAYTSDMDYTGTSESWESDQNSPKDNWTEWLAIYALYLGRPGEFSRPY